MRNSYKVFIVLSLLAFFTICALADTVNVPPSDDMYTDEVFTDPHATTELWVADFATASNYQRIMMKFDLSELEGETITSATLHLYRFFGCPSGDPTSTKLYSITQTWDENTWSETQHINHETQEFGSYVFSANGWQEIDLTSIVQEWIAGTRGNNGFVFQALSMNKFSKCYSKEASSDMRPYLEVVYGGSGSNTAPEIVLSMPPTPSVDGIVDESLTFMVRASDADNDSLTYTWKVDDNTITTDEETGTESTFSYSFDSDGQFTVSVDVCDGSETVSNSWTATIQTSGVNDAGSLPLSNKLLAAYPNPFNPSTKISFQVKQAGFTSLGVYNILGHKVEELQSGYLDKGQYEVSFSPKELSSGIYFIRLESTHHSATEKIIYTR